MELARISKLPDVRSAVLGDLTGTFLDAVNEPDGEAVAAIMGFLSSTLIRAGDQLGLGALGRISLSGDSRAFVVVVRDSSVITASVEPPRSIAAVEKHLDASLHPRDG